MAKELHTSKLVEISDDETSSSAISQSSDQGSTSGSANSTPSASKSKFAIHFVYSDKEKKYQCNYCRYVVLHPFPS